MSLFQDLPPSKRRLYFLLICIPVRIGVSVSFWALCTYISFGWAVVSSLLFLGGVGMLFNHLVRDARNPHVWWSRPMHSLLYLFNGTITAVLGGTGAVEGSVVGSISAIIFGIDIIIGALIAATTSPFSGSKWSPMPEGT